MLSLSRKSAQITSSVILVFILVLSSLQLYWYRSFSYSLILTLPLLFLITASRIESVINVPRRILILGGIFLFFALFSVKAVNTQNTIEATLLIFTYLLIFILVQSAKPIRVSSLIRLISIICSLFVGYWILFTYTSIVPRALIPVGSNQIVGRFAAHETIGYVAMVLIIVSSYRYITTKKPLWLVGLIPLIFVLLRSYSRTAVIATSITISIMLIIRYWKNSKRHIAGIVISFLAILALLLLYQSATSKYDSPIDFPFVNNYLIHEQSLEEKSFLSGRYGYLLESTDAIADKPLFGFGGGNYDIASAKHTYVPNDITGSSSNLLLDILVQYGVLAGTALIGIFALIVIQPLLKYVFTNKSNTKTSDKQLLSYLVLTIGITFMGDFTFLIQVVMVLFFTITGLLYQAKSIIKINAAWFYLVAIFMVFAGFQITLSNKTLDQGFYQFSFMLYPMQRDTYMPRIKDAMVQDNHEQTERLMRQYEFWFPEDYEVISDLVYLHNLQGNIEKEMYYKDLYFEYYRYPILPFVKYMYEQKLEYDGKDKANEFAQEYFYRFEICLDPWPYTGQIRYNIAEFCYSLNLECDAVTYK